MTRSKPYRPLIVIAIVFGGVALVVTVSKLLAPKEIIPWRDDFAAAMAESRATHKPVFAYFTATWCGPCQALKQTLWADRQVEASLRDFYPVKIDIDAHPDLAKQFQAESIPLFVILDSSGNIRGMESGTMSSEDFLQFLTTASATPKSSTTTFNQ